MKVECGACDFSFHSGDPVIVCPRCHRAVAVAACSVPVDFGEYRQILDVALEGVKRSIIIHGEWNDYSQFDIHRVVSGEFGEYCAAVARKQIIGKHGQIDELVDVIVTAVKAIRRLQCLQGLPEGWSIAPAMGGDESKVWVQCPDGEGGDFCRKEVELALVAGFVSKDVGSALERFFWEKF